MMPLALLIRVPELTTAGYDFVHTFLSGLSHANGWWINSIPILGPGRGATINYLTDTRRYEIGAVGTLVLTAMIVIGSLWYRATRGQRISVVLAVMTLLFTPLTGEALRWSHPEEFLLAGTIMLALLAAQRQRWTLAMVAVGLAFATKQPAWLIAPTIPFMLPKGMKIRGCALAVGVAVIICAPFLYNHVSEILGSQTGQLGAVSNPTDADPQMHIGLWGAIGGTAGVATRWFIPVLALLTPLFVAWRRHWQLTVMEGAAVITIVMLLRAVLDPFDISYYALPAVAALTALEQNAWLKGTHLLQRASALTHIPVFAICGGWFLGYVVGAFTNNWYLSPIGFESVGAYLAVITVFITIFVVYAACLRRRQWSYFTEVGADIGDALSNLGRALGLASKGAGAAQLPEESLLRARARLQAAMVRLQALEGADAISNAQSVGAALADVQAAEAALAEAMKARPRPRFGK
jgi:hypothetical protein